MEQKQIFGVILGVIVCIVMLFAGLYLTGQIGMKKNVVPAAAHDLWRKDDGCRGFDCLWIQCLRLYFR